MTLQPSQSKAPALLLWPSQVRPDGQPRATGNAVCPKGTLWLRTDSLVCAERYGEASTLGLFKNAENRKP